MPAAAQRSTRPPAPLYSPPPTLTPAPPPRYTSTLMGYAYDRFLPDGMTWRDLFDMVGGGLERMPWIRRLGNTPHIHTHAFANTVLCVPAPIALVALPPPHPR